MTRSGREPGGAPLGVVAGRWQAERTARGYRAARTGGASRRARRDGRLLGAALADHGPDVARVLDAPCGAGRLHDPLLALAGTWVGVDVSAAMLAVAAERGARPLVRAGLDRLPFADGSFDAVVACRILHHLDEAALEAVVRELVRVSGRLVLATFWDRDSLHAWRRRVGRSRSGTRVARSKQRIARAFAAAGADVVDWRHSLRFVSQQVVAVAEKRA